MIGRIVTAYPIEGEIYYLCSLLNILKGATSYKELKTINGIAASSFREATLFHGLIQSENYLEETFKEAFGYQMPYTLRQLFATIFVYCSPNNLKSIWGNFEQALLEDYTKLQTLTKENIRKKVILSINSIMESMGKDMCSYRWQNLFNSE